MGVPGLTAYFGLTAVGQPQAGQTVLVSSAAGGVGSLVAQMARRLGYRAVGIAGGPEKCRWLLDDLGLDAAIDYKGRDVRQLSAAIAEACPQGVDVFFDNVGGLVLDAALPCMNSGGRVVACGFISQYDGVPPPVMTNLFHIIAKGLLLRGFLLFAFADQYDRAFAALGRGSQAGQLRLRTQIVEGLDGAIPAFVSLFAGNNHGKPIVKI